MSILDRATVLGTTSKAMLLLMTVRLPSLKKISISNQEATLTVRTVLIPATR